MVKNPPANAGDERETGLIPGSGRSPGGGNGNPLQCSCLENPVDGGVWWATVHGVTKSWTRLSDFALSSPEVYTSSSRGITDCLPSCLLASRASLLLFPSCHLECIAPVQLYFHLQTTTIATGTPFNGNKRIFTSFIPWPGTVPRALYIY